VCPLISGDLQYDSDSDSVTSGRCLKLSHACTNISNSPNTSIRSPHSTLSAAYCTQHAAPLCTSLTHLNPNSLNNPSALLATPEQTPTPTPSSRYPYTSVFPIATLGTLHTLTATMADAFAVVRSFPPDKPKSLSPHDLDTQIGAYIKRLDKLPGATWTKSVDHKTLLELLDPAVHSIAYLKTLSEHIALIKQDRQRAELLFDQTCIFFASFDPIQIRFVGDLWRGVWEWAQDVSHTLGLLDVSVFSTALRRLDPSGATFTTLHLRFVRQCLGLGAPSQALAILDQNIFAYPQALPKNAPTEVLSEEHELSNAFITSTSGFSEKILPEHVLEYYLLGSYVYIGMRNFQRARLFLEHVILYPTLQHVASTFQMEAYKKWILVGLLSEGKLFPQPRTVDQAVWKILKAAGKPYEALADNFERRNWIKYQAEVDVGSQIWLDDGNMGLVTEAGNALVKYRVSDLQKTYAALTVDRVAAHLGRDAVATHDILSRMIGGKHLNASLAPGSTAGEAILRFNTSSSTSATSHQSDLASQTKRIELLVAAVRDADCRLQLTKEHVAITKRNKNTAAPDAELADQMDLSWDMPGSGSNVPQLVGDNSEDDEDIMV
jgi:COP9 signalosome complex subunit 3